MTSFLACQQLLEAHRGKLVVVLQAITGSSHPKADDVRRPVTIESFLHHIIANTAIFGTLPKLLVVI